MSLDLTPCPMCMVPMHEHSIMRCEPATELELHKIRRARETGKARNPTWYRTPSMPAPFKPQLAWKLPAHVLAAMSKLDIDTWPSNFAPRRYDDPKEYIRAFEAAKRLKGAQS